LHSSQFVRLHTIHTYTYNLYEFSFRVSDDFNALILVIVIFATYP